MIRLFFRLVVIAVLAAAAAWLADHPGALTFDWVGYRIETSANIALLILLLAFALLYIAVRFFLWLRRRPRAYAMARAESRRRQAYRLLGDGFMALGSGDAAGGREAGQRAARLLPESEQGPALLLQAQAAIAAGDNKDAEGLLTGLLKHKETEFAGLRGLVAAAIRRGEHAKALAYARQAADLRPDQPWLLRERVNLEAGAGNWPVAASLLDRAARKHALSADEARLQKAHIALAAAEAAKQRGEKILARDQALKAAKLALDFAPAQVAAAQHLLDAGKSWRAERLLRKAFQRTPHGDIAAAYLAAFAKADPATRPSKITKLIGPRTDHAESLYWLTKSMVESNAIASARIYAARLLGAEGESARYCRLMADIERLEWHNSQAVQDWTMRANKAAPDQAWVCRICGTSHAVWSHQCNTCQAFASLTWTQPNPSGAPREPGLFPALQSATEGPPTRPS